MSWSRSPSTGSPSPCPARLMAILKSILTLSTTSVGKGLDSHLPAASEAMADFNELPGRRSVDSFRPCLRMLLISLAMLSSGSFLLFGAHLPGEGRPAPSMKVFVRPFLWGFSVGPSPHQPSPRLGRLTPGSSASSSVVVSPPSATSSPPSSSDEEPPRSGISGSKSKPSLRGRWMPFSSMRSDAAVMSSALAITWVVRISTVEMSKTSSAGAVG